MRPGTLATVGLSILIDASRNRTLNRLTHKDPDKIEWTWDFVVHGLRWAAIPILAVLAAEYPGAAGAAWTKIGPMLHMFR